MVRFFSVSNAHSLTWRLCKMSGPTTQRRPQTGEPRLEHRVPRMECVPQNHSHIMDIQNVRSSVRERVLVHFRNIRMREHAYALLGRQSDNISMRRFMRACALHTRSPRIAANGHAQNERVRGFVVLVGFVCAVRKQSFSLYSVRCGSLGNRNPKPNCQPHQTRDTIKPTGGECIVAAGGIRNCARTQFTYLHHHVLSDHFGVAGGSHPVMSFACGLLWLRIRKYGKVSDC